MLIRELTWPALELAWHWPSTAITIAAVLAIAVAAHVLVRLGISRTLTQWEKRRDARAAQSHPKSSRGVRLATLDSGRTIQRTRAIAALLKSLWTFLLVLLVVLTVMATLGISLAPLLTSAGVGGLVLGIGAQSLVKDYLSGVFMVLEDQYGVGDQIKVGDITGTVEDVNLRITRLRDPSGLVWYIRNGEIVRVGNVSQGHSTGLIDIPVAYDADVAQVTEILQRVVAEVEADAALSSQLLEAPQLLGVESVSATTMTLRILIKTPPNQQYEPMRDIRERAMAALNAASVPGPNLVPGLVPGLIPQI
ncbi:MAG: mechanosensitive ion channel family protein [Propionibacteriaceae bacterium]|nr:mechanosensitive ion channel family protein [Propionibacteriaceae bacterium]